MRPVTDAGIVFIYCLIINMFLECLNEPEDIIYLKLFFGREMISEQGLQQHGNILMTFVSFVVYEIPFDITRR